MTGFIDGRKRKLAKLLKARIVMKERNAAELSEARWEARREINIRIVVQNALVVIQVAMVVVLTLLAGCGGMNTAAVWFAAAVGSFGFGQAWLHSGIRHAQYRSFFRDNLDKLGSQDFVAWEAFLKQARPQNFLGSHWYISTKLMFGASNLAVIAGGFFFGDSREDWWLLVGLGGVSSMALLVLLKHPPIPDAQDKATSGDVQ
jgi:hypothetical protein